MATINQVQLVVGLQLTATDAPLFTAAALTTVKIGRAIFCNTDTVPHTITINITTGTSSAANTVISTRTISPGETYVSPELAGQVLPPGASVRGLCSTANEVNLTMSGLTVTGN